MHYNTTNCVSCKQNKKMDKTIKYTAIAFAIVAVAIVVGAARGALDRGLTNAQIVCIDTGKGC